MTTRGDPLAVRLRDGLKDKAAGRTVTDVRLGLGYSAVQLDDGGCGLAYTFRDNRSHGCSVLDGLRPLNGRPAGDLLDLLTSDRRLEASLGLAAANALTNRPGPDYAGGDVLEIMDVRPGDRVGMVGYFAPMIADLKKRSAELVIFEETERSDAPAGSLRPAREALTGLADCQAAMLTATAVINHTLWDLIEAAANCREVVVLGASTPLWPELFQGVNVTLLSGVVAVDAPGVLRAVSEGGGARALRGITDKVNCRIERA